MKEEEITEEYLDKLLNRLISEKDYEGAVNVIMYRVLKKIDPEEFARELLNAAIKYDEAKKKQKSMSENEWKEYLETYLKDENPRLYKFFKGEL